MRHHIHIAVCSTHEELFNKIDTGPGFATFESQAFLLSEGEIINMDLFNVVKVHKIDLTEEQNSVG